MTSNANEAIIRKVCSYFPTAFGVELDNSGTKPKYFLDSVLGSGVSGTVIYARRVRDKQPFAIKVMDLEGFTPEDRMRATGEVCCLLNCDYFSIVKCHEDFVLKDPVDPSVVKMAALVLDYANAGDLRKEIRNRSRANSLFEEHEAMLLFIQILLAVHHVHSKRMIHRDIKSANILLCSNGLAKLGDFGFSRMYAATVSDDVGRTFCGTPYYVAPEIWRRRPYSKKADMFSLGVLLYELLTLKRPFEGATVEEVMMNTLAGRYEPLPSTISKDLQKIVAALLNAEPKKRPSSKKLLNTPTCKLYMSVVQEIIQEGNDNAVSAEEQARIMRQLRETKDELTQEFKMANNFSIKTALTTASPVSFSPDKKGYIFHGNVLKKQSSDLSWRNRYVCIYAQVETNAEKEQEFKNIELIQAVSRELLEQQCISIPFSDLEDAFPIISKYTGSDSEFAFAVAFKSGKRILFDASSATTRDQWIAAFQAFLGIDVE